jgi:hypothetical protein
MLWRFTVGVSAEGKADRIVVQAEDALVAALKGSDAMMMVAWQ